MRFFLNSFIALVLLNFGRSSTSYALTSSFVYDSLNRITSQDIGNGIVINYTYDAAGNRLTYSSISSLLPPTISTQPLSTSVSAGGAATFSVTASGTPPLSYQWKLNGSPVSGATSASLSLTGINAAHAGIYTVAVSNGYGSVTSQPALLTVLQTSFTGWQPAYFTNPEISNPAISGFNADPNYDGISNWLSFALGLNPTGNYPLGSLPSNSIMEQSGNQYLTYTYRQLIGITDIPYTVCVSSDLAAWDETESQIEQMGDPVPTGDGLTDTITVRLKTPITSETKNSIFFRLKIGNP